MGEIWIVTNTAGYAPEHRQVFAHYNANTMRWAATPNKSIAARGYSLSEATELAEQMDRELGGAWKPVSLLQN